MSRQLLSDQSDRMAPLLNGTSVAGRSSRLTTQQMNHSKSKKKKFGKTNARRSSLCLLFSASPNISDIQTARPQCMFAWLDLLDLQSAYVCVCVCVRYQTHDLANHVGSIEKSADWELWDKEPTCFSHTDLSCCYYCRVCRSHRTYKSCALARRWQSTQASIFVLSRHK